MKDNHSANAYLHTRDWEPVSLSQYDAAIAAKNREASNRLRDAMLAYYRKHHWEKAA